MDNNQRFGELSHLSQSEISAEFENVVSIHQGRLYLLDKNWSVAMAIAVFGLPTFAIIIICLLRMRLSHIEQHMNRNDNEAVSLLTLEDGSHIALLDDNKSEGSDLEYTDLEEDKQKPPKKGHSIMENGLIKVTGSKYGRRCLAATSSNSSSNTEETLVVILNHDSPIGENGSEVQSISQGKEKSKKTIRFALDE